MRWAPFCEHVRLSPRTRGHRRRTARELCAVPAGFVRAGRRSRVRAGGRPAAAVAPIEPEPTATAFAAVTAPSRLRVRGWLRVRPAVRLDPAPAGWRVDARDERSARVATEAPPRPPRCGPGPGPTGRRVVGADGSRDQRRHRGGTRHPTWDRKPLIIVIAAAAIWWCCRSSPVHHRHGGAGEQPGRVAGGDVRALGRPTSPGQAVAPPPATNDTVTLSGVGDVIMGSARGTCRPTTGPGSSTRSRRRSPPTWSWAIWRRR
jgi:hypothetical protein